MVHTLFQYALGAWSLVFYATSSSAQTLEHKPIVGDYTFRGCYTEGDGVRAVTDAGITIANYDYANMTMEECASDCAGYKYWGVEYSGECYCGNNLAATSTLAPLSDCSFICPGDSDEYCGAGNRLELYELSADIPSAVSSAIASLAIASSSSVLAPTPSPLAPCSYIGCYSEATNVRAFSGATYINYDLMSVEICATFCTGFTYFGVEYGGECYCGNSFGEGSVIEPESNCNMPCDGTPGEFCGAGNRLNVYWGGSCGGVATSSDIVSSTALATSELPGAASSTAVPTSSDLLGAVRSSVSGFASSTVFLLGAVSSSLPGAASFTAVPTSSILEAASSSLPGAASFTAVPTSSLLGAASSSLPGFASSTVFLLGAASSSLPGAVSSSLPGAATSSVPGAASSTAIPSSSGLLGAASSSLPGFASSIAFPTSSGLLGAASSTAVPTSSGFLGAVSSSLPGAASSSVPGFSSSSIFLLGAASSSLPGAASSGLPGAVSSSLPGAASFTAVPTSGLLGAASSSLPGATSSSLSDFAGSTTYLLGAASSSIPDAAISSAALTSSALPGAPSSSIPGSVISTAVPTSSALPGAASSTVFLLGAAVATSSEPAAAASSSLSGFFSSNLPGATSSTAVPASSDPPGAASSTLVPTSTLPGVASSSLAGAASSSPASLYVDQGCFLDLSGGYGYPLTGNEIGSGTAAGSMAECSDYCYTAGGGPYLFFDIQPGECWCGDQIDETAQPVDSSHCSVPCADAPSLMCGGLNGPGGLTYVELYKLEAPSPSMTSSAISSPSAEISSSVYTFAASSTLLPSSATISSAALASSSPPVPSKSSAIPSTYLASSSTIAAYAGPPTPSTVPSALDGTCAFIGCYTEATNSRALKDDTLVNYDDMTVEMCASFCSGYLLFGLEWRGECYCGDTLQTGSVLRPPTECDLTCDGAPLEFCGAGDRLDVYFCGPPTVTAVASSSVAVIVIPTPSNVQSVGTYKYTGCYTEATNSRALTSSSLINYDTMTVNMCASFCGPEYSMFGVEYSGECYCGNVLEPGSVQVDSSQCNMLCDGNNLQYCGGPSRLNLYSRVASAVSSSTLITSTTSIPTPTPNLSTSTSSSMDAYTYYGCQTEGTNSRALAQKTTAYNTMTIESCASDCAGYTYFGTEYGRECYCGNSFSAGSVSAPATDCNFPCAGNALETCGAGLHLSVYVLTNAAALPPTPPGPSNPPTVGVYNYYGCQTEGTYERALNDHSTAYDTMTLESCASDCAGFTYFGTEYGRECYCGDSFSAGSVPATAGECDFLCAGNSLEYCGAGLMLTVYETSV